MVHYKRTPSKNALGEPCFRYFKDSKPVKESSIPHEVMDKFEIIPETDYDDEPERRRCIFCDAPQKRVRSLNMTMVDLCEWHYQNKNLGKIAAQVRVVEKEMASEQAKIAKAKPTKKRKRAKKTAMSALVS